MRRPQLDHRLPGFDFDTFIDLAKMAGDHLSEQSAVERAERPTFIVTATVSIDQDYADTPEDAVRMVTQYLSSCKFNVTSATAVEREFAVVHTLPGRTA